MGRTIEAELTTLSWKDVVYIWNYRSSVSRQAQVGDMPKISIFRGREDDLPLRNGRFAATWAQGDLASAAAGIKQWASVNLRTITPPGREPR